MCFIALGPALHSPELPPSLFHLTSADAASRAENLHLALSPASEACLWTIRHRRGVRTLSGSSRGVALDTHCHCMKVLRDAALT